MTDEEQIMDGFRAVAKELARLATEMQELEEPAQVVEGGDKDTNSWVSVEDILGNVITISEISYMMNVHIHQDGVEVGDVHGMEFDPWSAVYAPLVVAERIAKAVFAD